MKLKFPMLCISLVLSSCLYIPSWTTERVPRVTAKLVDVHGNELSRIEQDAVIRKKNFIISPEGAVTLREVSMDTYLIKSANRVKIDSLSGKENIQKACGYFFPIIALDAWVVLSYLEPTLGRQSVDICLTLFDSSGVFRNEIVEECRIDVSENSGYWMMDGQYLVFDTLSGLIIFDLNTGGFVADKNTIPKVILAIPREAGPGRYYSNTTYCLVDSNIVIAGDGDKD